MNTPTHLLIGAAALARLGRDGSDRWRNPVILGFSLLPDLGLYVLFGWARFVPDVSEQQLWDDVYWRDHWQTVFAIGNSVPLYICLLIAGALWRGSQWGVLMVLAGTAALLHIAFDLPFHADDAHRHFWPITDWKFHSPLSYWDDRHHGDIVANVAIALGLLLSLILWRRFPSRVVRGFLIAGMGLYIAVPIYFTVMLGD